MRSSVRRRPSAADARPADARPSARARRPVPAGGGPCEALGLTWIPAPTSLRVEACSKTWTSNPSRSSASAAVRPPIPAPTIAIEASVLRHRARTVGRMLALPLDEAGGDRVTVTLPPDLSEQALSRALDEFVAAVGSEHVLTSEADLLEFRDPFWHRDWDDYEASAVVQPETVEEVQEIVRIANEHKVPIWVSGVGKNNGYGGSSPRVRGSVVVNLRRIESRARDERGIGLRGHRARRPLVRPPRRDSGGRPQADAVRPRPRLGQRGREHARTTGSPTCPTASTRA